MLTREIRSKILDRFDNKEEKILISNVLDKVARFEKMNKVEATCFLNLNEYSVISSILNYLKIEYLTYVSNKYADKRMIFFIPEYIKVDFKFYSNYVTCIKIISNTKVKLQHKDYMGSIYNLGIKQENIGDIFVEGNVCYFFVTSTVKEYFLQNLIYVGNQKVQLQEVSLECEELENITVNIVEKEYVVASFRVDSICSSVFSLSRNETKNKIIKGDLCVNDKVCYYPSTVLKTGDIISFRRCGKLIVKEKIKNTKNGNIILKIGKFC